MPFSILRFLNITADHFSGGGPVPGRRLACPRPGRAAVPARAPRRAAARHPRIPGRGVAPFQRLWRLFRRRREYVTRLRHGQATPQPWINVIARDDFGFHVSAEGAGFTWAVNSRDYQVTP
ncbi:hypothetical protein E2977_04105 (plasmid) [Paracoccus yeei]